jgi:hypothetical protein
MSLILSPFFKSIQSWENASSVEVSPVTFLRSNFNPFSVQVLNLEQNKFAYHYYDGTSFETHLGTLTVSGDNITSSATLSIVPRNYSSVIRKISNNRILYMLRNSNTLTLAVYEFNGTTWSQVGVDKEITLADTYFNDSVNVVMLTPYHGIYVYQKTDSSVIAKTFLFNSAYTACTVNSTPYNIGVSWGYCIDRPERISDSRGLFVFTDNVSGGGDPHRITFTLINTIIDGGVPYIDNWESRTPLNTEDASGYGKVALVSGSSYGLVTARETNINEYISAVCNVPASGSPGIAYKTLKTPLGTANTYLSGAVNVSDGVSATLSHRASGDTTNGSDFNLWRIENNYLSNYVKQNVFADGTGTWAHGAATGGRMFSLAASEDKSYILAVMRSLRFGNPNPDTAALTAAIIRL